MLTFARNFFWGNWLIKLIQFFLLADFLVFGIICFYCSYVFISEGGYEMAYLALLPAVVSFFVVLGSAISAPIIMSLRDPSRRNFFKILIAAVTGIVGLSPIFFLIFVAISLLTRAIK